MEDEKKDMAEEGSGVYEGSASDFLPVGASSFKGADYETGSGDGWADAISGTFLFVPVSYRRVTITY